MEGGRHGITCNAIVPGVIGTEAFRLREPGDDERIVNRRLQRPGEPQDVAQRDRVPLLRPAAYITGVGLNVSGGVEPFVF